MAVMVVGEAVGLTQELLAGMVAKLSEPMRRSPGFIALLTGPQPEGDGFRVMRGHRVGSDEVGDPSCSPRDRKST
jgi:hypothetical protein